MQGREMMIISEENWNKIVEKLESLGDFIIKDEFNNRYKLRYCEIESKPNTFPYRWLKIYQDGAVLTADLVMFSGLNYKQMLLFIDLLQSGITYD